MTQSIVIAACERYRVKPADLLAGKRGPKLTKVRKLAIKMLEEAGFSGRGIARMLRCNYSTVQYWKHASYREKRARYYKRINAERKRTFEQPSSESLGDLAHEAP